MASNDINVSDNTSLDMEHQLPDDDSSDRHPTRFRSWVIIENTLKVVVAIVLVIVGLPLFVSFAALLFTAAVALASPFVAFGGAVSIVMILLAPFIMMVIYSLPKSIQIKLIKVDEMKEEMDGLAAMYNQSRRAETLWDRIQLGSLSILARASLLLLVWFVLTISVPRLKTVILLGSPIWKWSLLAVTLTSGYFEALTLYLILNFAVFSAIVMNTTSATYYYYFRSYMVSMNLMIYFVMVLVSWLVYFSTDRGLKHDSIPRPEAFEYVTWTLVSLLIGSVLCVFKAFLLLKWSADAIYRRFEPRILITGVKYFFIGLLAADFFDERLICELEVLDQYGLPNDNSSESNHPLKLTVTKYVMSRKMNLTYVYDISRNLTSLAQIVNPLLDRVDEDDINSDAVHWFQHRIQGTTDKCELDGLLKLLTNPEWVKSVASTKGPAVLFLGVWEIFTHLLMNETSEEDERDFEEEKGGKKDADLLLVKKYEKIANVLHKIVLEECSSPEFTFDDLKIWMVDAHKDCINMGRTLADAKAIVTRLDAFISCVIFVIFLLLWLLITGLASTKVLVTIATPLLALTFIFGDTAKTFFQGLVFCFATHPFDVGDRCILDETELEVKSMSILTTTFIKIGSKEKRLYPNSVLATKAIVNLGWQPDPTDVVELTLDPSTNLENLDAKIQEFFNKESTHYKVNSYKMMMKEAGDNIKVMVKFTHVLTVHDLSHSQCLAKKSDQRSNFLKVIKQYINESQMKQKNVQDGNQTTMPYPDPSQPFHNTTSEIVELSDIPAQRKDDSTLS